MPSTSKKIPLSQILEFGGVVVYELPYHHTYEQLADSTRCENNRAECNSTGHTNVPQPLQFPESYPL